ncbi:acetyl-CoA C-acetyltransferase [Candidatus Pelagibacter sp.]|uniref:acetyl-CoA C-acetyltransferase n=1 Tax=Candidatus Pelagibacter sp. TaxID=2024849 RepID=UPI003F873F65
MHEIVIVKALRTPIGTYKGSLKNLSADKLGTVVIKNLINQSNLNVEEIDEVIMGQVLTAGQGQNSARQASVNAGIPISKPAHIINQVCGSGLRAIVSGYQSIMLNDSKIVIAGGQENMSRAPHSIFYRDDKIFDETKLSDTMINDGLMDAFHNYHMGITAENVAEKFNISREQQDEFALKSQHKTKEAIETGKFDDQIVSVIDKKGKVILNKDEHPRPNLNIEDLKKLKTVFKEDGSVTPGNSSGINDGAAAVILTTKEIAKLKNLEILGKIISWSSVGVDPSIMGVGPIEAINKAVKKANWNIHDVDLFEINEAFAAQSLAVIKELKIDYNKVNVNGGAIALGHPIGASGARIVVTLLYEMSRRNLKKGCASLCIGGGMGIAMCIERTDKN